MCVCVWGGIWSGKNASLFHVPHCLTIIVWKSAQYGNMAPGQQTQKPPRTPGPEAGAGICWTPKPKPADISAEGNLVCLCSSSFPFPILGGSVFAPRSNLIWEKLCLHGIRIYYSNWGELFRRTWGSVCSSLPAVKSFVANIDQHLNEAACLHSHHLSLEVPIRKIGWYFKSWWMEDMCFHGEMFEWFWSHYSK